MLFPSNLNASLPLSNVNIDVLTIQRSDWSFSASLVRSRVTFKRHGIAEIHSLSNRKAETLHCDGKQTPNYPNRMDMCKKDNMSQTHSDFYNILTTCFHSPQDTLSLITYITNTFQDAIFCHCQTTVTIRFTFGTSWFVIYFKIDYNGCSLAINATHNDISECHCKNTTFIHWRKSNNVLCEHIVYCIMYVIIIDVYY